MNTIYQSLLILCGILLVWFVAGGVVALYIGRVINLSNRG
jgi:hypothetical protein